MKKFLSTVLLISLTMTVISCNDNEREITTFESEVNNLDEARIIQGFINAKEQMKSLTFKTSNSSTHKVVLDEQNIKQKYKENLALINKETGLNLKYDEGEFKAMILSLESDYINNGFTISDLTYQNNLYKIEQNGSIELYQNTNDILNKIYYNSNTNNYGDIVTNRKITRGCAIALAGNFVATLGLSGCVTGVGCPVAIAGKVLAMASVADSCLS